MGMCCTISVNASSTWCCMGRHWLMLQMIIVAFWYGVRRTSPSGCEFLAQTTCSALVMRIIFLCCLLMIYFTWEYHIFFVYYYFFFTVFSVNFRRSIFIWHYSWRDFIVTLLHWVTSHFLPPSMWSLLEAEWSQVAEVCVALLLHFITLPCGADIFWKLCENHFSHQDWKIRFQAGEFAWVAMLSRTVKLLLYVNALFHVNTVVLIRDWLGVPKRHCMDQLILILFMVLSSLYHSFMWTNFNVLFLHSMSLANK